jgi:hypothetical protein
MVELGKRAPAFAFRPAAGNALTDYDVVMAFELFLGRNPESAAVIDYHKAKSFPSMVAGCLGSPEFAETVVRPLRAGVKVRRGDYRGKPSVEQLAWLARYIVLDSAQLDSLEQAPDWAGFFQALHAIGGVDLAGSAPVAAEDGVDGILERVARMRVMLADLEEAVRKLKK